MIEIEKKFLLTATQQHDLLEGAREIEKKTVEDSYFDTVDYRLTTNDLWLRKRDGIYELKAPLKTASGSSATNRYHEITDIDVIAAELGITLDGNDLEASLARAGVTVFLTYHTNRESYEKQGFHIDIDAAEYPGSDFRYALAEIELLVDDESQADAAEDKIIEFAQSFGLVTDQVILGKVVVYLQHERPEHYDALVRSGILK